MAVGTFCWSTGHGCHISLPPPPHPKEVPCCLLEQTWPDQTKDKDKDNYEDIDKDNDRDNDIGQGGHTSFLPLHPRTSTWAALLYGMCSMSKSVSYLWKLGGQLIVLLSPNVTVNIISSSQLLSTILTLPILLPSHTLPLQRHSDDLFTSTKSIRTGNLIFTLELGVVTQEGGVFSFTSTRSSKLQCNWITEFSPCCAACKFLL